MLSIFIDFGRAGFSPILCSACCCFSLIWGVQVFRPSSVQHFVDFPFFWAMQGSKPSVGLDSGLDLVLLKLGLGLVGLGLGLVWVWLGLVWAWFAPGLGLAKLGVRLA